MRETDQGVVLALDNVSRFHGFGAQEVSALSDVSLRVHAGELVAIVGPSGSGKSTLLSIAGGLDRPTSGTVRLNGDDLADMDEARLAVLRRRFVGYVFQHANLIAALTAKENVALPRELDGVPRSVAAREALEAMSSVGVDHLADRYAEELSGGEQQRVAIARAMIGDRRLVLADEPTGALDSATGRTILDLLVEHSRRGRAVVLVTHNPELMEGADRVVALRDGLIATA